MTQKTSATSNSNKPNSYTEIQVCSTSSNTNHLCFESVSVLKIYRIIQQKLIVSAYLKSIKMKINQTGAVMFLLSSVATLRTSLAFAPPKNSLVKRGYHSSLSVLRAEKEGKLFNFIFLSPSYYCTYIQCNSYIHLKREKARRPQSKEGKECVCIHNHPTRNSIQSKSKCSRS